MLSKPVKAIIKKNFLFHWKACLVMPAIYIGAFLIDEAEVIFGGGAPVELKDSLIFLWFAGLLGALPVNQSFQQESGVSTRDFLRGLPIGPKDAATANLLTSFLYGTGMILLTFVILILECGGAPVALVFVLESANLLVTSVYIVLYYTAGFDLSQAFYLGIVAAGICLFGYLGMNEPGWRCVQALSEPGLAAFVSVALAGMAVAVIAIFVKKKRGIL